MEAAEAKIQKVLEGSKQFLIPHFQRPYSWQAREWETLWRDLLELIEDEEAKPHFLGSIVSAPARSVPEGIEKRLLIDGQQRLTTIILILAVMRQRATAAGQPKLSDRIMDLVMNRHEDGSERYKLQPTQGETVEDSDREALFALIDGRDLRSTSGIQEARRYFEQKLARADAPGIEPLFRVISSKLTLVSIILDDKDNPHRIFESLNGKGRPLSQADLIRNYFFMRLPANEHEAVYRQLWQPMQRRLGEEYLTEFVRHYLMHFGQAVKESDIYSVLKERVDRSERPARQHLEELVRFAAHYDVLLRPEKCRVPAIRERLSRLQHLEVTVAYPFLLPLYEEFESGVITAEQLADVLDVLETYIVRRFVCGVPTHGLNKVFTPLYQQLRKQPEIGEGIRTLLAERACPRDEEFRERLDGGKLYGGGERRTKTHLILSRLEAALGHKEQVEQSTLSIEHVMPQTLTDWWRDHLGENWEDLHDQLLHTLGNLTLTSYNPELSNRAYPEKRELLVRSHVELNRYFSDVEHWNEGEIQRRADALTDLALTIWPYFGPAHTAPRERTPGQTFSTDDVTSTLPQMVMFRGTRIPVRSWREVLTTTMEQIYAAVPDEFPSILSELRRVVSMDPTALGRARRLVRLSNGAYLETNMSAAAIHRVCLQALQCVGIGPEEWSVERISLIAGPDGDDNEPPSETKQLQFELWSRTRVALDATGAFSSLPAPRPRHWFDISVGRSGFWLSLTANVKGGKLNVQMMMDEEEAAAMPHLLSRQAEIEKAIGAPLEWNPSPESKAKFIRLSRAVTLTDRANWPAAMEWLVKTAVAFKTVFGPRILQLESP